MLESVKAYFTPELLSTSARIYGESEIGISKALHCYVPAILTGILVKSGDTHTLFQLFNVVQNFNPEGLHKLESFLSEDGTFNHADKATSGQLINTIFGAKAPAITRAVASFSGIKHSTATALLEISGPLVLGTFSQKIKAEGLNASTMVSYLLKGKSTFASLLPAGVSALLGLPEQEGASASGTKQTIGAAWLWPLLLLLVLGIAVAYFLTK